MIGLSHYLTVAAILFTLGVLGIFINRKNIIGLAILVVFFRNRGSIAVEDVSMMKG
ncbi:hypothetical protein [Methylobacterium sp.]|uniref:hypothetical protein n=1 Tax=Methylobacterium sp. TaxID=409 RepID=UPI00257F7BEF|nr:hypothetical protein [Methylobacterium sp.]